jgi:hypothetical protein
LLRSRRFWFGAIVSAAFLILFFWRSSDDLSEIPDAFGDANYAIALAALPVYFAGAWMRTLRWQYLLRPVARIPARRLFPVMIVGLMANNVIPARAGELVRAWILGERERVSKAASLGTIAVDRLFDGLTLLPMLLIVLPFTENTEEFPLPLVDVQIDLVGLAAIMAVVFGLGLVVLFVLAFSHAWRDRLDRLITRLTPARFRPGIEGLAHAFFRGLDSLRSPADLAIALLLSSASWLLEATMYYVVGIAFGLDAGFHVYLLATAAANLAISVLASQGGVGPFELVVQRVFIAAGITEGTAAAYALGLHALVLLPVIALGLYFLGTMGFSLGEMFRRSSDPATVQTVPSAAPREEVAR